MQINHSIQANGGMKRYYSPAYRAPNHTVCAFGRTTVVLEDAGIPYVVWECSCGKQFEHREDADIHIAARANCICVPDDHDIANGGLRDDCPVHGDPAIINPFTKDTTWRYHRTSTVPAGR